MPLRSNGLAPQSPICQLSCKTAVIFYDGERLARTMAHLPLQNRRFIELRKHPRIPLPSSALMSFRRLVVSVHDEMDLEGEGLLLEISVGGCRIRSDVPLTLGKEYGLILQLSANNTPIRVETAIVRWAKDGAYGLKFMVLHPQEESRIKELIKVSPPSFR